MYITHCNFFVFRFFFYTVCACCWHHNEEKPTVILVIIDTHPYAFDYTYPIDNAIGSNQTDQAIAYTVSEHILIDAIRKHVSLWAYIERWH